MTAQYLLLEMRTHHMSEWGPGGHMTRDDVPGSVSSHPATGREVYLFGWINGIPGVWRSTGGADVEIGLGRTILTDGLEPLSDLSEPYKLKVFNEQGIALYLRFRLAAHYPEGSKAAPKQRAERVH